MVVQAALHVDANATEEERTTTSRLMTAGSHDRKVEVRLGTSHALELVLVNALAELNKSPQNRGQVAPAT